MLAKRRTSNRWFFRAGAPLAGAPVALRDVGLGDRISHKPSETSGGQRQRVAVARALVNKPSLVLADEPTGNLGTRTGEELLELFQNLSEKGHTLIVVTPEEEVARHARRIIRLRNGLVESDGPVLPFGWPAASQAPRGGWCRSARHAYSARQRHSEGVAFGIERMARGATPSTFAPFNEGLAEQWKRSLEARTPPPPSRHSSTSTFPCATSAASTTTTPWTSTASTTKSHPLPNPPSPLSITSPQVLGPRTPSR